MMPRDEKKEPSPGAWRAAGRLLAQVWLAIGGTLLGLALLETAARIVAPVQPSQAVDRRVHADSYVGAPWVGELYDEHRRSARMRWESYVYWRRLPFAGRYINIDGRGVRRTWEPPPAPPATPAPRPRVFFFGGSAAWGTGVRDDFTIASGLSRHLAGAGRPSEVTNFGETGYVSTQQVITLLRELQRGNVPDCAVFYLGGNDMGSAQAGGVAGLPNNEPNRRREFNLLRHARRLVPEALRVIASRSALLRLAGLAPPLAPTQPLPPSPLPAGLDAAVEQTIETNLRAVEALGGSYGFDCVFIWEPSIFFKRQLTAYEAERVARFAANREWMLRMDDRMERAWAVRPGGDVLYLGNLFAAAHGPRFIDQSHTNETANGEISAAIGRFLVARAKLAPRAAPSHPPTSANPATRG